MVQQADPDELELSLCNLRSGRALACTAVYLNLHAMVLMGTRVTCSEL